MNSPNIRNLLSLLRRAARQARETLEDIAESFPRHGSPRPSLVRVPMDARRRLRQRYHGHHRRFHAGTFPTYESRFGCRFFSMGCRKNTSAMMTSNLNPSIAGQKWQVSRSVRCASNITSYKKLSPLVWYQLANSQSIFRKESAIPRAYGARLFHSQYNYPRPSHAMRLIWESQVKSYRTPKTARPMSTHHQFNFPRPTTAHTILSSLARRPSSSSTTSSIPSLSELARAFHSQVPSTGSYVDFELTPHITIPSVTELTEEIVDQISNDLDRFANDLKRIAKDLRQVASLGELPLSVEHGKALRVYFANCDPDQVQSLLAGAEVTKGVVRSQTHSTVLSQRSDSSGSSSLYMSSSDTDRVPSTSGDEFYYMQESSSVDSFNIPNIRGLRSYREESFVSISTPSLTDSPSNETISEGSSALSL